MKNFTLEIFDNAFPLVTYYTVRWDEEAENETNKFISKFSTSDTFKPFFSSARRIWEAVQNKMILIDEANRRIVNFDGTDDETLL